MSYDIAAIQFRVEQRLGDRVVRVQVQERDAGTIIGIAITLHGGFRHGVTVYPEPEHDAISMADGAADRLIAWIDERVR